MAGMVRVVSSRHGHWSLGDWLGRATRVIVRGVPRSLRNGLHGNHWVAHDAHLGYDLDGLNGNRGGHGDGGDGGDGGFEVDQREVSIIRLGMLESSGFQKI